MHTHARQAVTCNSSIPSQRWHIDQGTGEIVSSYAPDGRCFDVPNCRTGSGVQVQVSQCHVGQPGEQCNSTNQVFQLNSDGTIHSALDGGGYCLDVYDFQGPVVQARRRARGGGGRTRVPR